MHRLVMDSPAGIGNLPKVAPARTNKRVSLWFSQYSDKLGLSQGSQLCSNMYVQGLPMQTCLVLRQYSHDHACISSRTVS